MAPPPPRSKRLYKVWKGSNKFFCWGRLIFGPDVASLLLSIVLIVAPALLFCYQVVWKIHKREVVELEEAIDQRETLGLPVLVVTVVVLLSDLTFLILTSSRDPGIIPRSAQPPDSVELYDLTPSTEWVSGSAPHLRLPRTKDVHVNGFSVKVKYCDTCMLYRPPRASHCSICNNCVQKFDHHCPWVGQCIGLRNYRFFFLFISTSTFLCIFIFTFSWINIIQEKKTHHNSLWKSIAGEVISIVLIAYTFIAVWFVGGLTVFHTYLMSKNQTTYENFRYRYDRKENPFNLGSWGNIKDVFFTRIPLSMNDFRSWVQEDTDETGSFTSNIGMHIVSSKEKFDIEMGSKLSSGGNIPMPSILQNMDYSSIDDDLKEKGKSNDTSLDSFSYSGGQESTIQEPRDCNQSGKGADTQIVEADKRADQTHRHERDKESFSTGDSASVNHGADALLT